MNIQCACGSKQFKAQKVTLVLRGVPCEITSDGPEYDDKAADYSEGWDYNNESRVTCVACGKEYEVDKMTDGCPACGGFDRKIVAGKDCVVESIEVNDD